MVVASSERSVCAIPVSPRGATPVVRQVAWYLLIQATWPAFFCEVRTRTGGATQGGDGMKQGSIGRRRWIIADGYIPCSDERDRRLVSHETACILNTGDRTAHVDIVLYFADREPVGPYRVEVPARRTLHLRFNDLDDPEPVPRETDYSAVIAADIPIVVQHTRLDSRDPRIALLSTVAHPA
jgi:hypothetical protein